MLDGTILANRHLARTVCVKYSLLCFILRRQHHSVLPRETVLCVWFVLIHLCETILVPKFVLSPLSIRTWLSVTRKKCRGRQRGLAVSITISDVLVLISTGRFWQRTRIVVVTACTVGAKDVCLVLASLLFVALPSTIFVGVIVVIVRRLRGFWFLVTIRSGNQDVGVGQTAMSFLLLLALLFAGLLLVSLPHLLFQLLFFFSGCNVESIDVITPITSVELVKVIFDGKADLHEIGLSLFHALKVTPISALHASLPPWVSSQISRFGACLGVFPNFQTPISIMTKLTTH